MSLDETKVSGKVGGESGWCQDLIVPQPTTPPFLPLPPPHTPQRLVDTAMLAAVGGLAYALGAVLRLQPYMR